MYFRLYCIKVDDVIPLDASEDLVVLDVGSDDDDEIELSLHFYILRKGVHHSEARGRR